MNYWLKKHQDREQDLYFTATVWNCKLEDICETCDEAEDFAEPHWITVVSDQDKFTLYVDGKEVGNWVVDIGCFINDSG